MNFQLLNVLILATIFLTPLIGATNDLGYEQVKVLFFILSNSLIGFIWLLGKPACRTGRPKTNWNLIKITSAVFILILFITSVLGVDLRVSFLGNEPYFQGWILYAYLFLFALMVSQTRIKLEQWAFCLTGSSMFVGLIAIKDWMLINIFGQQIPTYAGRVVSTFGQPNFYAGFLLLTLPFSYFLFKSSISQGHSLSTQGVTLNNKKLSYFGTVSGLIAVVGIFVSFSRSTILLGLALLILGLIDQLKIKFKIGLIVFGIIIASLLIALRFSSGIVGNEVSQPILTNNPDLTKESVEKRVYIWPEAVKIALQKPILGFGLENIDKAFADYFEKNKHSLFEENLKVSPVLISLKDFYLDRTHNYLLDMLIFSGGIGLVAWLILVYSLLRRLKQQHSGRHKNVLLVSLIVYLVWVQFQNQSIVHLIYFWLLVGLIDIVDL